jgi:hypothetical protein
MFSFRSSRLSKTFAPNAACPISMIRMFHLLFASGSQRR